MMLTGSLLEAPPDSEVMLTGAVCITLHKDGPPSAAPTTVPNALLAGAAPASTLPAAAKPVSASSGWWGWIVSLVLGK
jgi:hypothetical protein